MENGIARSKRELPLENVQRTVRPFRSDDSLGDATVIQSNLGSEPGGTPSRHVLESTHLHDTSSLVDTNINKHCTPPVFSLADVQVSIDVDAVNAAVAAAENVSASTDTSMEMKPPSDPSFAGIIDLIAGGMEGAHSALYDIFPSKDELISMASSYGTDIFAFYLDMVKESIKSPAVMLRLNRVLEYLSKGGNWQGGLTFQQINEYLDDSSRCPVSSAMPTKSPQSKSPRSCATLLDASSSQCGKVCCERVEGDKEWREIEAAVTETDVQVDQVEVKYKEGVQRSIINELEDKLDAQLNIAANVKCKMIGGQSYLQFFLRCAAYSNKTYNHECLFKVEVLTPLSDPASTRVRILGRHKCDATIDYRRNQNGLTLAQKAYVDTLFDRGDTPYQVWNEITQLTEVQVKKLNLLSNNRELPDLKQLQTYARNRSQQSSRFMETNLARIEERCQELCQVPDDEHAPFILDYHITSEDNFCIVMSTKSLLKKLQKTSRRTMDGTYKLLKSGYPVLIMGVDDADRHNHSIIFAVSATEQGRDFEFVTKAVNKHVPNVHVEINLMADAAPAIGNGLKAGMNEDERTALLAESVLASMESADQLVNILANMYTNDVDDVVVVINMCYFHMKKACKEQALGKDKDGKLLVKERWNDIEHDIDSLHNIPFPFISLFECMLSLFYKKWRSIGEGAFIDYFEFQWGKAACRWSRCHQPCGYASCNNGLENGNRTIKLIAKHRRQFFDRFFVFMQNQVRMWSLRKQELVTPATRPPLLQSDWVNYRKYRREREGSGTYGYMLKETNEATMSKWKGIAEQEVLNNDKEVKSHIQSLCNDTFEQFQSLWKATNSGKEEDFNSLGMPAKSFNKLRSLLESFYVVTLLPSSERRSDMHHACTCPVYSKTAKCKHAMHVGMKTGFIKESKHSRSIDRKPKRGRPKKTANALNHQPLEYSVDKF